MLQNNPRSGATSQACRRREEEPGLGPPAGGQDFSFAECEMGAGPDLAYIPADEEVMPTSGV